MRAVSISAQSPEYSAKGFFYELGALVIARRKTEHAERSEILPQYCIPGGQAAHERSAARSQIWCDFSERAQRQPPRRRSKARARRAFPRFSGVRQPFAHPVRGMERLCNLQEILLDLSRPRPRTHPRYQPLQNALGRFFEEAAQMRAAIAGHLAREQRVDELVLRKPPAKPYVRRRGRHADEVRPAFLWGLYHREIQTQQVEHVLHLLHPDIREDSVFQLVQRGPGQPGVGSKRALRQPVSSARRADCAADFLEPHFIPPDLCSIY